MTAQIAGFDTRAEIGLRPPLSISHNIDPSRGGSAVHYGGGGSTHITLASSHTACRALWIAWQNYHMDGHGWMDIAYTGGYCQHGFAMAGRGLGVRTAANGTNDSNDRFLAFVFLGCADDVPTTQALDALDWWLNEARVHGHAGMEVKPHSALHQTSCPGDRLRAYAATRDGKTIPLPGPAPAPKPKPQPSPTPKPPAFPLPAGHWFGRPSPDYHNHSGYYSRSDRTKLTVWQKRMAARGWHINTDGLFSPLTADVCEAFQRQKHLTPDRLVGPVTWAKAWTAPITSA